MNDRELNELKDRLDALEMLSKSILSEIKILKEILEESDYVLNGRRYKLSDL